MVHFGAGRNDDGFPELRAHRNGREETNEEQDSENSYSNHACLLWNGLRGELWFTPHLSARGPYSANFQDEHSPTRFTSNRSRSSLPRTACRRTLTRSKSAFARDSNGA